MLSFLIALLVSLAATAGMVATVLGLPGVWLIVIVSITLTMTTSDSSYIHVAWSGTFVILGLAIVGEVLEFVAGAAGVGKLGGSKRAGWLALAGSIIGAIAGLFIGLPIPIPLIGPLITSIAFGCLGAALGALIGERWVGRDWNQSAKVGAAAATGRLLGTVGKAICAAIMMVILIWSVWF